MMRDPKVLAVTTSSPLSASIAVGRVRVASLPPTSRTRAKIDALQEIHDRRRYRADLLPTIERMLDETDTSLEDLDRLVVDIGPGRTNSAQVGIDVVRAIAQRHDISVMALDAFEILYCPVMTDELTIGINAGDGQVCSLLFADGDPIGPPRLGLLASEDTDYEVFHSGDWDWKGAGRPLAETMFEMADHWFDERTRALDEIVMLTVDTLDRWIDPTGCYQADVPS